MTIDRQQYNIDAGKDPSSLDGSPEFTVARPEFGCWIKLQGF
jgi:hypothetical protein